VVKFSIIIAVRKINDFVKENITHIKGMSYRNFEVLIITDEKEEYDFQDDRFILLNSGNIGPGEKRNLGARKAKGEILAFLDDDSYPEVDWLTNADKIFKNSHVYALGGPAVTPKDANYSEKIAGKVLESVFVSGNKVCRYIPRERMGASDYPSVNLFVRKQAFIQVGGFKKFWPGEDTKLCLDLVRKHGRNFLYDPSIVVYHHRRPLMLSHLKQISRYAQQRGQFARVFPETSRVPIYFVPSAFVIFLVLGPAFCYFLPFFWGFYYWVIFVYLSVLFIASAIAAFQLRSLRAFMEFLVVVFMTHITYGLYFMVGLISKPKLKLRAIDQKTGNYIGG